jgi:hypothetical protein
MKEEYPCFKEKGVRYEYSEKISNIFKKKHFNWSATPALFSPNVFVKPNIYTHPPQLNTEALPFTDVARISLHTKEGIARLGIMAYPSMDYSPSKKALEERGYNTENIEGHPGIFFLVKPLDSLEKLVDELRKIELILSKREV